MAEIKNSFLRSKMNKDLDDRLIPNGEYRDAQNISVGKSEDDDIGALETVLGNTEKTFTITPALPSDIQTIGYLTDEYSQTIFVFATNYTDLNPNVTPTYAPSSKRCIIYSWSPKNPATAKVIADGVFLNFSTTNPIQASLIENLLFFTDNRNQPRKVNINEPTGYYTEEVQLSVAKYNPYTAISLIKTATATVEVSPAPTTTTFVVDENAGILVGMFVTSMSTAGVAKINPDDFITVISAVTAVGKTTVTLSKAVTTPLAGDIFTFLISTMTNKSSDPNWPGDPDYLEGRYVRFSYRYRFDDGEYSIFAPFTQIAYIPKQKGYFKSEDEDNAFRSTIVAWMENNVNNIELLVTLPINAKNPITNENLLSSVFKIKSLDILYKESDQTTVKVLETIPVGDISNDSVNNIYTYEYQSRKPYKTLPSDQTIRVYDKVPVRALSQETAGNRIIYGNFRDTYSAPNVINYGVSVINKSFVLGSTSWIEYPNHSLKQNRNYQVGFILADKYGRQSPVILSPITSSSIENGSTIFNPYNNVLENMKSWFGDTLQLSVTQGISSGTDSLPNFNTGEPGLYAIATSDNGFAIKQTPVATITDTLYTFTLDSVSYTQNVIVPVEGNYLRGEYVDYVKVNGPVTNDGGTPARYTVPTDGRVNSSYLNNTTLSGTSADLNFAYTLNPVGWYSYKIVVKQTEQDYYNAYLPGIVNGYFGHTEYFGDEVNQTAFSTLFGDNINKIPRDLSEVGPDQKQYRSSVLLSGRVTNVDFATTPFNAQYFPGSLNPYHSVDAVGVESILAGGGTLSQHPSIYQNETDPSLIRISTDRQAIGQQDTQAGNADFPVLAIYETDPQDSLLDIFWETGTVGLISDLNADILTGYDGPTSFTATSFELLESDVSGHYITDPFFPVSNEGQSFNATYPTTATMTYTSPRTGDDNKFILEQDPTLKSYRIKTLGNFVYLDDSITQDVYQFSITVTVDSSSLLAPGEINTININGALSNAAPSFVNSPLPNIIATVDQIILPNQDISAVNGSSYVGTEKVEQLKWSILSGNPTGLDGQPSFEILDSTVGQLTQRANNTPNGQHTIVLKIEDANGDTADGSLLATANQNIFIGPEPANNEIKSTCVTGPIDANTGIPNSNALITNFNGTNITGVWYIAAAALQPGYTSGTVNSDIPITPSTSTSISNTLFRLGTGALTQGQIVLSLNSGFTWANTPPPAGLMASVGWKVWHRSSSSSAWAHITDLNNKSINPSGISIPVALDTANTGSFDNFYNQIILGFSQSGEYCIAAIDAESSTAAQQSQALTCWVNSNDLNYSTCVIEDGANITGGTARASYEYGMSTSPGSGYNCSYGTSPAWSNVPYGQYVPQFFNSSALSIPYSFADAGGGISGYLAFKTQGSSPFDDPSSYRYSFSTRFTTADGKIYKPNPWTQCYIENCGNTAAATSTCTVLQMEYPY